MDSIEQLNAAEERLHQAEDIVLSLMLGDGIDLATLIRRVDHMMFSYRRGRIFRTVVKLHQSGLAPTPAAVRVELTNDRDYESFDALLIEIENTPVEVEYADDYIEQFTELSYQTKVRQQHAKLTAAIQTGQNSQHLARIIREYDLPKDEKGPPQSVPIGELIKQYPHLREPIIDGIQRRGEVGEFVAATKAGKSWGMYSIALSVATGRPWLGMFPTEQGRVLFIDNELHPETLADRIPKVAKKLFIPEGEYHEALEVISLRGHLTDYYGLERQINAIRPGEYSLIIVDAHYRMLPVGVRENENSAEISNLLDRYAAQTEAGINVVHHSTKGVQSDKRVTDVGSGGSTMARAADFHLILREHQEPDHAVLEAALRSWKPMDPVTLKWEFPLWIPTDLDPSLLKRQKSGRDAAQEKSDNEGTADIFDWIQKNGGATESELHNELGMGKPRIKRCVRILMDNEQLDSQRVNRRGNDCDLYTIRGT